MGDNEILVPEEGAENAEQLAKEAAEGTSRQIAGEGAEQKAPKLFTQEEVDEMMEKRNARFARKEARIRKEYEGKYGELEEVLRAGTGKQNVEEITDTFKGYYSDRGLKLPEKPSYSEKDIDILAKADADDIISGGYEDIVEEVDRLAAKGVQNMTPREKAVFKTLADHRKNQERAEELSKLGITEDIYKSNDFRSFASKINSDVPMTEVYSMYKKMNNTSVTEKIGSMKNGAQAEEKQFYTPEEVDKLTSKDYDDPKIMRKVRESMKHWR